jgi:inactivated superfamily I helicase
LDRGGKQRLQSFWSEALAPAGQRTRIARQLMLEVLAAAEPLPIRVLDPALHHGFIGQVEGVLEIRQPDHQACWLRGSSEWAIEAAKLLVEAVPIDESCQAKEFVALIEHLIEPAAVEVAGARHRRLGSHGKTPSLSGSAPRNGHFTMLREDEESFNLNQL